VDVSHFSLNGIEGWLVELDGRTIQTPDSNRLLVPTKRLAYAIASEWDAQTEKIIPHFMPLVRMDLNAPFSLFFFFFFFFLFLLLIFRDNSDEFGNNSHR
jgi:hypothetical protein